MNIEKGNTCKALRDKQGASAQAKEQLKEFNRIKKAILEALKEDDLTIMQLAEKLNMSQHDTMYNLLTLVKYGFVATGEIDDMDEYYTYKIKEQA